MKIDFYSVNDYLSIKPQFQIEERILKQGFHPQADWYYVLTTGSNKFIRAVCGINFKEDKVIVLNYTENNIEPDINFKKEINKLIKNFE
jgi:hypothetical protein